MREDRQVVRALAFHWVWTDATCSCEWQSIEAEKGDPKEHLVWWAMAVTAVESLAREAEPWFETSCEEEKAWPRHLRSVCVRRCLEVTASPCVSTSKKTFGESPTSVSCDAGSSWGTAVIWEELTSPYLNDQGEIC